MLHIDDQQGAMAGVNRDGSGLGSHGLYATGSIMFAVSIIRNAIYIA